MGGESKKEINQQNEESDKQKAKLSMPLRRQIICFTINITSHKVARRAEILLIFCLRAQRKHLFLQSNSQICAKRK